jgi:hypothetical protein
MRASLILALVGAVCVPLLTTAPAHAQATRTWVSGVGDDVNPCSRTAPCKTFAGAVSKTAANGEINCLDSGGFGTLTITKSMVIKCQGVIGSVLANGLPGFIVNLPAGGKAVLDGLDIEGVALTTLGTIGVRMIGAGSVTIINSLINGFSGNGVDCVGTTNARCFVYNSRIINNGGGVNVAGAGGVANSAFVENSLVDGNTSFAVQVSATGVLVISGNSLSGSPSSIIVAAGGQVISYGNNVLRNAGAPTSTLPLQ